MNCADIENLICDYVDGTLAADTKSTVERHLAECPACAELVQDSTSAVAFMETASEEAPPPELVTRILFDAPWRKNKISKGIGARLGRWFGPILQPRFVMGAAMTILSFSILARFTPVRPLKASDLQPKAVWHGLEDRAMDAWDRSVKFYDNLKFVYQIQTTLREWQQQDEEQRPVKNRKAGTTEDHKLPVKSAPGGGVVNPPPGGEPANAGGGKN